MNKNTAYAIVKRLAPRHGVNITQGWVGSKKEYWVNLAEELNQLENSKSRNVGEARAISRRHNIPLMFDRPDDATNQEWAREVSRLKNIVRRREKVRQSQQPKKRPIFDRAVQLSRALGRRPPRWVGSSIAGLVELVDALQPLSVRRSVIQDIPEYKARPIETFERLDYDVRVRGATARMFRYSTEEHKLADGNETVTYKHQIPEIINLDVEPSNLNEIKRVLTQLCNIHKPFREPWQLVVEDTTRGAGNGYFSTSYDIARVSDTVRDMITRHLGPYARGSDSGQDISTFTIRKVHVRRFIINASAMGSSHRSFTAANKKWVIVNPKSDINCLYQALAVSKNFITNTLLIQPTEDGHQARVKAGKNLKYLVKPSNDNYADDQQVRECCDYLRKPINLYDNQFKLIKTFTPKKPIKRIRGVKCYDIQRSNNHAIALIRRADILKFIPNLDISHFGTLDSDINALGLGASEVAVLKAEEEEEKKEEEEAKPIKKRKFYHKYNEKIATFDIETSPTKTGKHTPYACAFAWWGDNKKAEHIQFWGLKCLQEMTDWIYANISKFRNYTLYAHNGGKYDVPLMIERAFIDSKNFIIEGRGCLELNNAWIGFTLRDIRNRKNKIFFKDSYRLLPKSLASLCEDMKVEHQKLTETVNHSDITLINYNTFPQLKDYLRNDVLGLLEVLDKFGREVFKSTKLDITKCFTGASLSKKNFFKNYYNPKKYPVYTLTDAQDDFIRSGYFGGRVECFDLGELGKLYYYDFTSLYPAVGRRAIPYGKPELFNFNGSNTLPAGFFGFVKCRVRTINFKAVPKHCVKIDGRLTFPIFKEPRELVIFTPELDSSIYEYEFLEGYKFKKGNFLKKFFTDGFLKKALAKLAGNPALAQAYKIIINSGYGFWGLRTRDRDGVIIAEPGDLQYLEYLKAGKLNSIINKGEYNIIRVTKDLKCADFNVAVAAAISSYARCELYGLITDITKAGGRVSYCDTDSIICNINLAKYPKLQAKWQWDGNGEELGSLKNEADDKIKKLIKKKITKDSSDKVGAVGASLSTQEEIKKIFKKVKEAEAGNVHLDRVIITGCKQYAFKRKINIQGVTYKIEDVKLKGFRQKNKALCYDDMKELLTSGISQKQAQFRCPKSNYTSATEFFDIKTKYIKKNFKRVYTKGVIFQNIILPHII